MKKRWLIISLVAVLLAGIAFVSGMSLLRWDFRKLDTATWENRSFQPENPVTTLTSVKIKVAQAKVTLLTGDTLKITYEESEQVKYSIELTDDGNLTVTENYQFFNFNLFNFYVPEMQITLPPTDNLDLESTNGDLDFGDFNCQSLSVKLTNGNINLTNLQVENGLSVKTTNGKIKIENLNATAINLATANGEISTSALTTQTLVLKTTNGHISAQAVTAAVINAQTTNGSIDLTVIGNQNDYTITANTVNGKCHVPSSGNGACTLIATTVNGNIDIKFVATANE